MSDGKSSESPTEPIFELLSEWRHLPAYQLERRADIFFALYLPTVLESRFGAKIMEPLIPEFPIKYPTKRRGEDRLRWEYHTSKKVDFFALQESKSGGTIEQAFLVELKTDMGSRREKQDEYLDWAVRRGLNQLTEDILEICRKTKERRKYVHLLRHLAELRLIKCPRGGIEQLHENAASVAKSYPNRRSEEIRRGKRWGDTLRCISAVDTASPKISLVYIQPRKCKGDHADRVIVDFCEFAAIIEERAGEESDGIQRTFTHHLKEWAKTDAGLPRPRNLSSC